MSKNKFLLVGILALFLVCLIVGALILKYFLFLPKHHSMKNSTSNTPKPTGSTSSTINTQPIQPPKSSATSSTSIIPYNPFNSTLPKLNQISITNTTTVGQALNWSYPVLCMVTVTDNVTAITHNVAVIVVPHRFYYFIQHAIEHQVPGYRNHSYVVNTTEIVDVQKRKTYLKIERLSKYDPNAKFASEVNCKKAPVHCYWEVMEYSADDIASLKNSTLDPFESGHMTCWRLKQPPTFPVKNGTACNPTQLSVNSVACSNQTQTN